MTDRNELLEASKAARDALQAFRLRLRVISDDLDLDPQVHEALKLLWGHETNLDAVIATEELPENEDTP